MAEIISYLAFEKPPKRRNNINIRPQSSPSPVRPKLLMNTSSASLTAKKYQFDKSENSSSNDYRDDKNFVINLKS